MKQELDVYFNQTYVGRLTQMNFSPISFAYDLTYVERGLPTLSVSMPPREKPYRGRVVKSVFFTPLPDFVVWRRKTYGRLLRKLLWKCVPDPFARERKARYFYLSDRERFTFLGNNGISAGAIGLCPCGTSPSEADPNEGRGEVLDGNLIREIIANPRSSIASMGGQHQKIPVHVDQENEALVWERGRKAATSTHILKNLDERDTAINELFCMRLGQSIGLRTPTVEMHSIDGITCLLVERYDRTCCEDGQVKVLHQETFCQALGVPPGVVSERRGGPSIKRCLDLLKQHSIEPRRDQIEFLTQIVFCYLIGCDDFNGRNLSLVYRNGQPELAPAHDLMGSFSSRDKLDMTIGGVRYPEEVHLRDWNRAVEKTNFHILREQLIRLPRECSEKSRKLLQEFEREGMLSEKIVAICSRIAQRAHMIQQRLPVEP